MWPDRRLIELLQIEHPLVLAPMLGIGTIELAASACAGGGLGSIGCAGMQPELAAQTIQALRGLTHKPINVNFFCHIQARADADREQAWRDRLSRYYCELGIQCGRCASTQILGRDERQGLSSKGVSLSHHSYLERLELRERTLYQNPAERLYEKTNTSLYRNKRYSNAFSRTRGRSGGVALPRVPGTMVFLAPPAHGVSRCRLPRCGSYRDVVLAFRGMDQVISNLRNDVPKLQKMLILPECGHWTQQERPQEVNEAMIEFLKLL